ncbi:MAG: phosphotransferase, partial [Holophagales bacterium]|nr:phosphotransferase [Holophagales bacterium]
IDRDGPVGGRAAEGQRRYAPMILTASNLLHHLLERGLIDVAPMLLGDVRILEMPRRHRNFMVSLRGGAGWFVKQAQSWDPQTLGCLQREGTCGWLAEHDPAFGPLHGKLPSFLDYDPVRQVLVTELIAGAETLNEHHLRHGMFPIRLGAELGRLLGELHTHVKLPAGSRLEAVFPGDLPRILELQRGSLPAFLTFGEATSELVGRIVRDPVLTLGFEQMAADWRRDVLIHGDLKLDNCLLVPSEIRSGHELRLIDWELADLGDAGWDVGSVFQTYLAAWIFSQPVPAVGSRELVGFRGPPIERMQPLLHAFWAHYCGVRGFARSERERQLHRSLRLAAARMAQTAFETTVATRHLGVHAWALLGLGRYILADTDTVISDLLGL